MKDYNECKCRCHRFKMDHIEPCCSAPSRWNETSCMHSPRCQTEGECSIRTFMAAQKVYGRPPCTEPGGSYY